MAKRGGSALALLVNELELFSISGTALGAPASSHFAQLIGKFSRFEILLLR